MSFAIIAAGVGVVTAGVSIYSSVKQANAAKKIHPEEARYEENPNAKDQLATAKQYMNARMPGATDAERNILASQANFNNTVSRSATDSGQALALGGLSQGSTNNAFNQLGINEANSKVDFLNNLNSAFGAMINEGDKKYQSEFQKYQSDVMAKTALRNASAQNLNTGLNQLGSSAFMASQDGSFADGWGGGNTNYGSRNLYQQPANSSTGTWG